MTTRQRPTLLRRVLRTAMQIKYGALVPLPVDEAFDFVSDPANWPRFFVGIESAEALEGWGAPGGKARLVIRIRGQEVVNDLELLEWNRPHRIRYIAHAQGRRAAVDVATVNDRPPSCSSRVVARGTEE